MPSAAAGRRPLVSSRRANPAPLSQPARHPPVRPGKMKNRLAWNDTILCVISIWGRGLRDRSIFAVLALLVFLGLACGTPTPIVSPTPVPTAVSSSTSRLPPTPIATARPIVSPTPVATDVSSSTSRLRPTLIATPTPILLPSPVPTAATQHWKGVVPSKNKSAGREGTGLARKP